MKAVFLQIAGDVSGIDMFYAMYDNSNNLVAGFTVILSLGTDITASMPGATLQANINTKVIAAALANGWTITASDIVWSGFSPFTPSQLGGSLNMPIVNSAPGRALVTIAAAANGFQVSATRPSLVAYSITIVSTANLSGGAVGYDVLEICSTNSTTASDWVEIARTPNGASVSLAIALTSVSTGGGQVVGMVPAGYYARIRSVNTTGTPAHTLTSQQESVL